MVLMQQPDNVGSLVLVKRYLLGNPSVLFIFMLTANFLYVDMIVISC